MHDIKRIRDHGNDVRQSLARKGVKIDLDKILELDSTVRKYSTQITDQRAELNRASKAIGIAKREGRDAATEMEAARQVREQINDIEEKKKRAEADLHDLLFPIPAEPDPTAPDGLTEAENIVVRSSTEFEKPDYELQDHVDIAEKLGILDMQRGAKVTGSAFPVYNGEGAALERALLNYMLDRHTRVNGYREIFPPFLVNVESARGTGQLPKLKDDMYYVDKDEFYLIPTAEVPITNLHRDEVLEPGELPLKYAAYSACFRREAGTYGADTRGLLRVHQFNKVELVQIVPAEESEAAHQEILRQATEILDELEISYRVVELCAGEMSFAASKCYDIEVWSPAQEKWLEASSVSNFRDFQARRMNLRYRPEKGSKPVFPHTLNGSALATSRLMVALIEQYQTPEGRIRIPRVLQPYLDGLDQIRGFVR